MRWSNLRLAASDEDALFGANVVARTFDTPEFAGMEFYEVKAKSIINKVPGESRVPFSRTINPYRGCGHACSYCLGAETPVLLASGLRRPLAELRVGDAIYGTVPAGNKRIYTRTEVLAHWATMRRAYRVTIADGTRLIASGDHRFLTNRGWKHVTGASSGARRRPHLTSANTLAGAGGSARVAAGDTVPARRAELRVQSVEDLGIELLMYDITTGTGDFIAGGVVSHNCFARNTHTYLDLDSGPDFDRKVVVKVNAPEVLRRELAAPSWTGEHIAMGTNVDCYQRAEGRYRLMPGIIGALRDARNPFSILTKGTLIRRDLDLIVSAAAVTDVGISLSVGFVDRAARASFEPGAPGAEARLNVCRAFRDAGIGCGVLMAPILPYVTDSPEQLEETVGAIAAAGATSVTPIVLHLRTGAREWHLQRLARDRPELVSAYEKLYGDRAYAPRAYQREIADRVDQLARRYGIGGDTSTDPSTDPTTDTAAGSIADDGRPNLDRSGREGGPRPGRLRPSRIGVSSGQSTVAAAAGEQLALPL